MNRFTEDNLVQKPTADYLQNELGWRSVFAYNNEDFGPDSLLGRRSEKEVVLVRTLREKLVEFNPGKPEEAYDDAIRQITETSVSQTITATNREKHDLLLEGISVRYTDESGERVKERLRVFDFDQPENNDFLCVRELWVKGDLYRRRADIVGFVNGLPLLFIECKNVSRGLKAAYEGNYLDYRDTVPHLFHYNAMIIFANGIESKVGSITSKWGHFQEWKRLHEEDPGVVDMETMLKGICNKTNFIDLLENFIFFDESTGDPKKIIAKNHQFLGVNKAVEAVRNRESLKGRLGVFWHTQGSGKSYSMVMFTRKVHRKLGGNFTFLMLTDRDDLDTQLYKTFAGCGVVNNDRDPCRAASGQHLKELLREHKSHVFTLVQKFNQRVPKGESYTSREDIIVITDEAHRTQYGTLSLNMRDALPNASFMGFTGTPLFGDDEITKEVFGDYISTYTFDQAVEDGATVPLLYDSRGEKLHIDIGDLNERIADVVEEHQLDDVDAQQQLDRELRRDYHILTAEKRLDQIARDFVKHYSQSWETGKAMFVCIDKLTCVKIYDLIMKYWLEEIASLEASLADLSDEQELIQQQNRITWMKETIAAVVVSEEQGEVAKFRKWGLDIEPHRRLMKEKISLPESMRSKPQFRNMQRMDLDDAFKAEEHPFRIAIVCAMWLTGFDVPSLATLYLDKPLKAHTLMQAIARANRVHEGKANGLVVDYCGILHHLRSALATFAGGYDGPTGTDPVKPADEELLPALAAAIAEVRAFLHERGASLDDVINKTGFEQNAAFEECKNAANQDDETRKRFEIMCREIFKKFKFCRNQQGVNEYRDDRDAINKIYERLQSDRNNADISAILQDIGRIVDAAIDVDQDGTTQTDPINISHIDFDRLKAEFERSPRRNTTVQNLREAVEQKLRRMLNQNPARTDFQSHYEEIVAKYNGEKDEHTIEHTFEALFRLNQELDEEDRRTISEGLDDETLAIFDLLKKPDLNKQEIKKIKEVAVSLLETLKAEQLKIDQWKEKETTRDAIKQMIHDYLWGDATGLPEAYTDAEIEAKAEQVYEHIFRAYPYLPSPLYSVMA